MCEVTATVEARPIDALDEQIMRFAALGVPGTRDVQKPSVTVADLAFRGMAGMGDATLEAVLTAMRDEARAQYETLSRWVRVIRARRALSRKSERAAAKETGVSRAAVRKATTAAKRK